MPKVIENVIRIQSSDPDAIQDIVKGRLVDFFSSVSSTPMSNGKVAYKGGSILKPYGFDAVATTERIGKATTVLKISGRPKMNFIAYLFLVVVAGLLIFGLSNPQEGFLGIIAAIVMIIASIIEQRRIASHLERVGADTALRFP